MFRLRPCSVAERAVRVLPLASERATTQDPGFATPGASVR